MMAMAVLADDVFCRVGHVCFLVLKGIQALGVVVVHLPVLVALATPHAEQHGAGQIEVEDFGKFTSLTGISHLFSPHFQQPPSIPRGVSSHTCPPDVAWTNAPDLHGYNQCHLRKQLFLLVV